MSFNINQKIKAKIPNIIGDNAIKIVDKLNKFIFNESIKHLKVFNLITTLKETVEV
jgi:hypothetical protein